MNPSDLRATPTFRRRRVMAGVFAVAFATGAVLPTDGHALEDEDVFYQLGVAVGRSLTEFQLSDEEFAAVKKGMTDILQAKEVGEPTEEVMKRLGEIRTTRVEKAASNYLAEVKAEDGAEVQESGLVYFEVEPGSGQSPSPTDTVKVHYHGTLTNGTVFDSSVKRGKPTEFPLNRVIPCWTEGVGKMKVGGKAKLVCPPDIAYGERGAPPTIPGGSVLTFDVELIEITPAPEAAAPAE